MSRVASGSQQNRREHIDPNEDPTSVTELDAEAFGRLNEDSIQNNGGGEYADAEDGNAEDGDRQGGSLQYAPNDWTNNAVIAYKTATIPLIAAFADMVHQILREHEHEKVLSIVTLRGRQGRIYRQITNNFNMLSQQVFEKTGFVFADEDGKLGFDLGLFKEEMRRINLSVFYQAIFGSSQVGFFHLNTHFLDTFCPDNANFTETLADMYVELKTQAYISALCHSTSRTKREALDDLFPVSIASLRKLFRYHGTVGSNHLEKAEERFLQSCEIRRAILLTSDVPVSDLRETYPWDICCKRLATFISENYDDIARGAQLPDNTFRRTYHALTNAEHVAHSLSQGPPKPHHPKKSAKPPAYNRTPWSKEEQEALLAGLQETKGPNWSAILALHGKTGTKSHILKNRTQVQLKDKARNMKVFFLRTVGEDGTPEVLKKVTGRVKPPDPQPVASELHSISLLPPDYLIIGDENSLNTPLSGLGDVPTVAPTDTSTLRSNGARPFNTSHAPVTSGLTQGMDVDLASEEAADIV